MITTIKFEELINLFRKSDAVSIGGELLIVSLGSLEPEYGETYTITPNGVQYYTLSKKDNEEVKVLNEDTYLVNIGEKELVHHTELEVVFLTRMSHDNTTRETNPQNYKILSILDYVDGEGIPEEIDRIRMDALEVFCGQSVDDDWYDGYLYDGTVQIMTTPCMEDGYLSEILTTNRWLRKNVDAFVENHSDLISEFDVGASENTHEVTFINRDLTEDQLNKVFIDFIEFLRSICPCEVIGSIERNGAW